MTTAVPTCDHEPIGVDVYTAPGQFLKANYPAMTHIVITIRGAQSGTSSDGTPGEMPNTATIVIRADQLEDVTEVEPGRGGRGAPRNTGMASVVGGAGGSSALDAAEITSDPANRMPDGEDGYVLVAVYDCSCTP